MQKPCFARARGPANDAPLDAFSQGRNSRHQLAAKGFIAPFNDAHLEANLSQDESQGTTAFATAPAIDQRLPVFGQVNDVLLNVPRNIGGNQACAFFLRLKRANLLVQSADLYALFVVQ